MAASAASVQAGRFPVRLLVWGITEADQDRAISEAGKGWGRELWQFTDIERLTGTANPLPKYDRHALAAGSAFGWAYIAYAYRGDR